jgi:hypothetical protein
MEWTEEQARARLDELRQAVDALVARSRQDPTPDLDRDASRLIEDLGAFRVTRVPGRPPRAGEVDIVPGWQAELQRQARELEALLWVLVS